MWRASAKRVTVAHPAVPVGVAVAPSFRGAVAAALSAIEPSRLICPGVLLADPALQRGAALTSVRSAVGDVLGCAAASLSSPPRGTGWQERPVGPGAERFATVHIPGWATDRAASIVTRLPLRRRGLSPFALLGSETPLRQRLAARLSQQPRAAVAELASCWRIPLVVLIGSVPEGRVAVATPALLAAELVWLASEPFPTLAVAPWEDAAIQRAAALGLQPAVPAQLQLVLTTPGAVPYVERLWPRLGLQQGATIVTGTSTD